MHFPPERRQIGTWARAALWLLLAALFAYLVLIRTWNVSQTFWLLEDQERDWSQALVDLVQLRMTGSPSHVGGNTLGPLWYWMLWASRHVIGPWTGYLPHTGAIALALVQSAADVALLIAIGRRTGSWWLAAAVVILAATSPWEVALNAAMWSPEFSVAFAKITIALVLLSDRRPSHGGAAAIAAMAWVTFQAHSTGFFVALPVFAGLVFVEFAHGGLPQGARRAGVLLAVVAVLQVPFVVDLLRRGPDEVGPTMVLQSMAETLRHPATIQLGATFHSVGDAAVNTLIAPWAAPAAPWIMLFVCGAVAGAYRRDMLLVSATAVPVMAFVMVFSLQRMPFDSYYVLPLVPGLAVAAGLAVHAAKPVARPVSIALALAVLVAQPARVREALTLVRFHGYGALAHGSQEIRRRVGEIQNIETAFPLPPTTDPTYIFWALGGRVAGDAAYTARIEENGTVTFTRVAP